MEGIEVTEGTSYDKHLWLERGDKYYTKFNGTGNNFYDIYLVYNWILFFN